MRKVKIATASILIDDDPPQFPSRCIGRCLQMIDGAGERGADLVVLPEEPDLIGSSRKHTAEEIPGGEIFGRFCERAARNRVYVIYSQRERSDGAVYNTGVLIDRHGNLVGKYRKTHLAPGEDAEVCPGDAYPVFPCDFGRVAIGLCMDLHYPELWRIYALEGADILCLPTMQIDYTGDHIESLCNARAIDNQVYFVTSPYVKQPFLSGRWMGHARVIDPYGRTLADTSHKPGLALAEVDLDEGYEYWATGALKTKYPTLKECYLGMRRPETYRRLVEADPARPLWRVGER